jgi:peptidyl-dipeptidase A
MLVRELGLKDPSAFAYSGRKEVGQLLKDKVFGPGARYSWNEMIRRATGEPLTANYYATDFVKE